MKLYPPVLERTIPAFYTNSEGTVITVPFSMNRAVSLNQVQGYELKIKAVQDNSTWAPITLSYYGSPIFDVEIDSYVIPFIISEETIDSGNKNHLTEGNFYKIQMAYINTNNELGYYSTVSIVKYTTYPKVYIKDLQSNNENNHTYIYTGIYKQSNLTTKGINKADVSEKAYSYRFILIDSQNNIIDDTGFLLCTNDHNKETYESNFNYSYTNDIPENENYILQFIIKTNNNLIVKSPQYILSNNEVIPITIDLSIIPKLNYNNGYIEVNLEGPVSQQSQDEIKLTKEFLITRTSEDSNYKKWEQIFYFYLNKEILSKQLVRDFTIEQGKTYIYSIQEKLSDGSLSSRIISEPIYADFEDIFLYDGKKQLKLRFNPKISNLKINNAETKTDTIGSKYPSIFKNKNIKYKETNIGGLISYLTDEEELFISEEDLLIGNMPNISVYHGHYDELYTLPLVDKIREFSKSDMDAKIKINGLTEKKVRTTALTDYSIGAEQIFKNKAIDWLGNGQIKLLKSPTEGNMLVYLTNVSLTPEDKISRTIHSFQATAYEISDFTYQDLIDYNIRKQEEITYWASFPLSSLEQPINPLNNEVDTRYIEDNGFWYLRGQVVPNDIIVTSARFEGVTPGAKFAIRFKNSRAQSIIIGPTGNYSLDLPQEIYSITIPSDAYYNGILTYTYKKE